MNISLIFANELITRAFGNQGKLPWQFIKEDMQFFQKTTENSVVVMGLNTWRSLPKMKKLGRDFIVISSTITEHEVLNNNIQIFKSFESFLEAFRDTTKPINVIGGVGLLSEAIEHASTVYMSSIHMVKPVHADVYVPVELMNKLYSYFKYPENILWVGDPIDSVYSLSIDKFVRPASLVGVPNDINT
ncbi:trimethoprim-resistant dihydrofolate reductase DfrA10 [Pseudomonas aeruginosa]|nr:trimethoprim-resistant dihydrofolate reductase DfrA10 [Pseudomonas aeruginosa]